MFSLSLISAYWIDLLIICFIIFLMWDNWNKGFLSNTVEFTIFLASFISAIIFYPIIAYLFIEYVAFPYGLANGVSLFILTVVFQELYTSASAVYIEEVPEKWPFSKLYNKFAFLPIVGQSIIITAFFSVVMLCLPISSRLKVALASSKIAPVLYSNVQKFENSLNKILPMRLGNTLIFLAVNPRLPENVKLHFTVNDLNWDEAYEQELFKLINKERIRMNFMPFVYDTALQTIARGHVSHLAKLGYLSNWDENGKNSTIRMNDAGISFLKSTEIVALSPDSSVTMLGIMTVDTYRLSLLSPNLVKSGIGVVDAGIYGRLVVIELTD